MSIFFKISNCCIIIVQTTNFEKIQYCKIYFYYGIVLAKTSNNESASFFWKIFSFQILIFKNNHFLKFSNYRIIIAQTSYFEKIQYCKIYFYYDIVLDKTSNNDLLPFFGRYSHFKFDF